eukprot:TRINITY_DN21432_c0_g2_i1.p1 TRINITY_DN21432_c0_g2~~TRINITY_DN21432_c0_g2_i1.p1  ORF type:complete len:570 (+),score=315.44 TRINITY_DN21432_c0_g2_i1:223-1710(+)
MTKLFQQKVKEQLIRAKHQQAKAVRAARAEMQTQLDAKSVVMAKMSAKYKALLDEATEHRVTQRRVKHLDDENKVLKRELAEFRQHHSALRDQMSQKHRDVESMKAEMERQDEERRKREEERREQQARREHARALAAMRAREAMAAIDGDDGDGAAEFAMMAEDMGDDNNSGLNDGAGGGGDDGDGMFDDQAMRLMRKKLMSVKEQMKSEREESARKDDEIKELQDKIEELSRTLATKDEEMLRMTAARQQAETALRAKFEKRLASLSASSKKQEAELRTSRARIQHMNRLEEELDTLKERFAFSVSENTRLKIKNQELEDDALGARDQLARQTAAHAAWQSKMRRRLVTRSLWFWSRFTKLQRLVDVCSELDDYLSPTLTCSFCLSTYESPYVLACGHSMCLKCIDMSQQQHPDALLFCATCETQCDEMPPVSNSTLDTLLSRYDWWVMTLRESRASLVHARTEQKTNAHNDPFKQQGKPSSSSSSNTNSMSSS